MRSFLKNLPATIGAWSFEILAWIAAQLPFSLRYRFVSWLGVVFGLFARDMRNALQTNLLALLQMQNGQLQQITDAAFRNFAITLCDFFLPDNIKIHVPKRKKLEDVRKKHKGILLLTFHMGHWELGARTMRRWGWPVTAVYQPYQNRKFKEVIESRRAPGVNFIPVGRNAANGVREALRQGDVVAMLGDHPFGEEGIEVNLLGHRVIWPKGPVLLAVREKRPIVVAVVVRTKMGEYTALIEDPLIPKSKARAEVDRLVQEVADKFGKFLHQYPTQWYRFRPFEFV